MNYFQTYQAAVKIVAQAKIQAQIKSELVHARQCETMGLLRLYFANHNDLEPFIEDLLYLMHQYGVNANFTTAHEPSTKLALARSIIRWLKQKANITLKELP